MGSFLNVVAYRLPIMMQREWDAELAMAQGQEPAELDRFNMAVPASHCTHCKKTLRWWHNIPVLSWLFLKAKCGFCGAPIGARYPIVEAITGALFIGAAYLTPLRSEAIAIMALFAALITLTLIDLDTCLLPDSITLPLVWCGLIYNMVFHRVPLEQAVIGAIFGYMILWIIYQAFKLVTGKEGMGYGDFKLLAAIGAWFGALSLVSVILVSSVAGVVFGLAYQAMRGKSRSEPFPFGPSIVVGAMSWFFGFDISKWI